MIAMLGATLAAAAAVMTVAWGASLVRRDASVADIAWGPAFALAAIVCATLGGGAPARRGLVVTLVLLWAIRLSVHLALRARGRGEDSRYVEMRRGHGARFWWVSLFTVFLLQAALVALVSLPVQAAAHRPAPLGWADGAGTLLFAVGLVLEVLADAELTRFKADPRSAGQVLDRGLWRFSRHPNYFGEAVLWWGIGLIGASTGSVWTLLGPASITLLLLKVSGVTLLERTIIDRRPAYADYIRRTSAFVPWRPR